MSIDVSVRKGIGAGQAGGGGGGRGFARPMCMPFSTRYMTSPSDKQMG